MNDTAIRILAELYDAGQQHSDWAGLVQSGHRLHIAVMVEPFLSLVFEGRKTVESRFSHHRIAPYRQVQPQDIVLMKAGPIVGCFTVAWVSDIDLTQTPIQHIATTYGSGICGDADFWRQKADKRYATLLGITSVRRLSPLSISKADRRAWLTLAAPQPGS